MIDEERIDIISNKVIDVLEKEKLTDLECEVVLHTLRTTYMILMARQEIEQKEGHKVKVE